MDYKEKVIALLNSKELSQEQKEKLESIFSELAISEDEKIRKEIIDHISNIKSTTISDLREKQFDSWIAWLEKQGETFTKKDVDDAYIKGICDAKHEFEKQCEQKPTDKVEPKFHEGEWINGYYTNYKVLSVNNNGYVVEDVDGNKINILFENEKFHHLWTIQDAKDGDVVVDKSDGTVGIFQSIGHHPDGGSCNDSSYCFLHCRYDDGFFYADFENGNTMDSDDVIPATKEQRYQLEKAMADAGYTFDFGKKDMKKIEQKPAWSEEDETMLERVIKFIPQCMTAHGYNEYINWFESLKEREQPKQEWSEGDKRIIDNLISQLGNLYARKLIKEETKDKYVNWLKSLRPKSQWKPSDEQTKQIGTQVFWEEVLKRFKEKKEL